MSNTLALSYNNEKFFFVSFSGIRADVSEKELEVDNVTKACQDNSCGLYILSGSVLTVYDGSELEAQVLSQMDLSNNSDLKDKKISSIFALNQQFCLVGTDISVNVVDTLSESSKYLYQFDESSAYPPVPEKTLDSFCIDDSSKRIIATVGHKYIFTFEGSNPKIHSIFQRNGNADETVVESAVEKDLLVIHTSFEHGRGAGHSLVLIKLKDGSVETKILSEYLGKGQHPRTAKLLTPGSPLNAADEHQDSTFTLQPWKGIIFLNDKVLIGAKNRGVIIIKPTEFQDLFQYLEVKKGKGAKTLNVGGVCLDLIKKGNIVYALVDKGNKTEIAVLEENEIDNTVELVNSFPITHKATMFVPS